MLMLFRLGLLCLLSFALYAKSCPDVEYLKIKTLGWDLVFVHKGFKKDGLHCETMSESIMKNYAVKPMQEIPIEDGVVSIDFSTYADLLIIKTFAGAHSGKLYFFKKEHKKLINVKVVDNNVTYDSIFSDMGPSFNVIDNIINNKIIIEAFQTNKKRKIVKERYIYDYNKSIIQRWKKDIR